MTIRVAASLLVCLLLAVSLQATTYVVPDDAYLVSAAQAIVRGTVVGTHVRRGETVTEVLAEEWIKGDEGAAFSVVHPVGVQGVPSFAKGDEVLLFLERNGRGEWTTWAFSLGAFRFDGDVLVRAGEVSGWTVDGKPYVERARLESQFVDYVRAVARGAKVAPEYFTELRGAPIRSNAVVPSPSYAWRAANGPFRRSDANVAWHLTGNAGDLDLAAAVDAGIAEWNAVSPKISFTRSPAPPTGDRPVDDDEARIIAGDPHGDVPGTCCIGVLAITFWRDHGTHDFGGQTYATVTDADIVLNDKMSSSNFTQGSLTDVITHELGHSLGLRHADKTQTDGGPCNGDANCCINTNEGGNCAAVMNSQLIFKQPGLTPWDRDAVACLYDGNCATTCTAPVFLQPPPSRVVYESMQLHMSTTVRATLPLELKWYRGITGDVAAPVATGWQYEFTPGGSAEYWVRATGACGTADSSTASVTVVECPGVTITSASATMVGTEQVRLDVTAAGGGSVRYRWFRRNAPGAPETLIAIMKDLTTKRVEGATYFVRVENPCGNSATSAEMTPSATPPAVRRRRSRH